MNCENMPAASRVWIYQSNRLLTEQETHSATAAIETFVQQWTSHSNALSACGRVWHNAFIVLMVDENQAEASGCSIDKSVAFVRQLGEQLGVDFFDRFCFAYLKDGAVQLADRDSFAAAYAQGLIDDNTLVYNNLIKTKAELKTTWFLPLGQSWHKNFV